ncbi:MAG: hypothetical protein AAF846_18665 [Chloroflexota bacterium]
MDYGDLQEQKPKNKRRHTNYLYFFLIWVITLSALSFAQSIGISLLSRTLLTGSATVWQYGIYSVVAGLIFVGIVAFTQKTILLRLYGISLQRWILYTLMGTFVAVVIARISIAYIIPSYGNADNFGLINFAIEQIFFLLFVAGSQWWILRQHFRGSWIWIVTLVVAIAIISVFVWMQNFVLLNFTTIMLHSLTALALIWMLRSSVEKEKRDYMVTE